MAKKAKHGKKNDPAEGLWIAPRYSLKGANGEGGWDNHLGGPPNSRRLLELADIALGLKKPAPNKKRLRAASHETAKTEPYFKSCLKQFTPCAIARVYPSQGNCRSRIKCSIFIRLDLSMERTAES